MADQAEYDVRCEWGIQGLRALAPISDVLVIVDVLSFSTAVDIAVANGAAVLPSASQDQDALLASPRNAPGKYSLSPASLLSIPPHTALILPSPNGGALSVEAGKTKAITFTACLRNCEAVADCLLACGSRIAVIPAGEQWSNGTLRPAMEDLIGAGAVLARLSGRLSPEAELAVAVFERFRENLPEAIARSVSGRELVERGFTRDVELAAAYASSSAVPVLHHDRFVERASRLP